MNRILELEQQRAALNTAAQAISQKAQTEKRLMTKEERATVESNLSQIDDITAQITTEQRLAASSNIPTDRRTGTTVHDNIEDNPCLFGVEARGTETPQQRKARLSYGFGQQLVAVKHAELVQHSSSGGQVDPRLFELQRRATAAAGSSEAVPADGGFLIQPDFSDEILANAHDVGEVHTRARNIPLSEATNAIKIPGIDEQSRADGSRWGGVRMYWENEADALTGSKPKFRLVEMVTKKLTGLFYATNELLTDARALGSVVMQAFGEETAFKLDDGCIRGTGAGQMQGILNSSALITVNKETAQASATIVWENIKKMRGRMWARSRKNSVWFINQDCEQQLQGMAQVVGTGGVPVWLPAGGAAGLPYDSLFGRPVIPIEQCDTLGALGDILYVDMSQYMTVDKGGMQSAVSMHVRFLTDEQTYRWIYRCDGQSQWHTPLTPFKGSNTLSPFIALQAR